MPKKYQARQRQCVGDAVIVDRAKAHGSVRVWPIGAASVGSKGEAIAEIAAMKEAGIVAVSDDGKPIGRRSSRGR